LVGLVRGAEYWGGLLEEFQVTAEGDPIPGVVQPSHVTLLVKVPTR
jgi:hypothetical protein